MSTVNTFVYNQYICLPFRGNCDHHEHWSRDGDVAHRPEDVGEEEEEPLRLPVGDGHARWHDDEKDDLKQNGFWSFFILMKVTDIIMK